MEKMSMLSVIVPVYNEVNNLGALHGKLLEVLNGLRDPSEVIYVDDGSTDGSFDVLREFAAQDAKVKVIRLAKNFGQTLSIQAGVNHSKGDILIFIDADLQNDPADIPKLLRTMAEGFDMVSGWRKHRKDPLFHKRIPSYIGNRLISLLFGIKLHDLGCTLKAYKRDVIMNIKLYGEMHRLLPLHVAMRGASLAEVEVSHNPRGAGKTHYGWSRILKVFLDLITIRFFETYATKPIYFFGGAGVCLLGIGTAVGTAVVIRTVFFKGMWVSPLLFISLFSITMGVQFILMGLLAELIMRIYYKNHSEDIQAYIIKDIFDKNN
jgi:glycosyltransferase involved in cell wall biosynthesis